MKPVHFAVLLLTFLLLIFEASWWSSLITILIVGIIAFQIGDRFLFDHDKKDRY